MSTRSQDRGPNFSHPCLGPDKLWRDIRAAAPPAPRAALFLDRDGVVIEECHYLSDRAKVKLLPGIPSLIKAARRRDMAVVQVANQGGIGRGIFDWPAFVAVEARVTELLAERGVTFDGVFACPFHPQGQGSYAAVDHPWRKPNPGMFFEAARYLNLDLGRSLLVGDKLSDILAARAAGLPRAIHVRTGHGTDAAEEAKSLSAVSPGFEVIVATNAEAAIEKL